MVPGRQGQHVCDLRSGNEEHRRHRAKLKRLVRLLAADVDRFLPQLRIFLLAVGRSLPGTFSFLLVGALLLYVYAMVGWVFFARHDPEHYGSLGRAALSLFLLMTLDGIGDAVRAGLEISPWSIFYYASFVLLASFVLVNVLIGVVITSLDEVRDIERENSAPGPVVAQAADDAERQLRDRMAQARHALDELEESLERFPVPRRRQAEARVPSSPGHT